MEMTLRINVDEKTLTLLASILKGVTLAEKPRVKMCVPKNRLVNGTWVNTFMRLQLGETLTFTPDLTSSVRGNAASWNKRFGCRVGTMLSVSTESGECVVRKILRS